MADIRNFFFADKMADRSSTSGGMRMHSIIRVLNLLCRFYGRKAFWRRQCLWLRAELEEEWKERKSGKVFFFFFNCVDEDIENSS